MYKKGNLHLLCIAEELIQLLENQLFESSFFIINKMQIKKRQNKLNIEDKKILINLKISSKNLELCCIYIILEQWLEYEMSLDKLNEFEKNIFQY